MPFGIDPGSGPWQYMSRPEKVFMWCVVVVCYPIVRWEKRRKK